MARRAKPIPKDAPKYWRMPIVAVLRKGVAVLVDHCVGKNEGRKAGEASVMKKKNDGPGLRPAFIWEIREAQELGNVLQ